MSIVFWLLAVTAYLCGSIPFAKIVGWRYGIDIQRHGSGNIGFANTVRLLGWKAGFKVLPGDVLKGLVPTALAVHYLPAGDLFGLLAIALLAVLGHIFPVWLRFRGGKGIATGLGVTLVLCPAAGLIGLAIYVAAFLLFRQSAPASLLAAWTIPLWCLLYRPEYALFYTVLALLLVWTHRSNLKLMAARMAARLQTGRP